MTVLFVILLLIYIEYNPTKYKIGPLDIQKELENMNVKRKIIYEMQYNNTEKEKKIKNQKNELKKERNLLNTYKLELQRDKNELEKERNLLNTDKLKLQRNKNELEEKNNKLKKQIKELKNLKKQAYKDIRLLNKKLFINNIIDYTKNINNNAILIKLIDTYQIYYDIVNKKINTFDYIDNIMSSDHSYIDTVLDSNSNSNVDSDLDSDVNSDIGSYDNTDIDTDFHEYNLDIAKASRQFYYNIYNDKNVKNTSYSINNHQIEYNNVIGCIVGTNRLTETSSKIFKKIINKQKISKSYYNNINLIDRTINRNNDICNDSIKKIDNILDSKVDTIKKYISKKLRNNNNNKVMYNRSE